MHSLGLEIFIIVVLSLFNGLLAMAELAIVSANRVRLNTLAERGDSRAKTILELSENSAEFLATVQIGITAVAIVAGVFGGATIAEDFSAMLQSFSVDKSFADPIAFSLVIGTITYLSVVFGELVPKQIALAHPERVALIVAPPLLLISRLCRPLVWLLENSSLILTKMLPFKTGKQTDVSEEEIRVLISQGTESGEIMPAEKEMAFRVFRLADRPIRSFMTPRRDVVWLNCAEPFDENWKTALATPHSYFPVSDGTLDNIIGVVSIKDLCLIKEATSTRTIRDFVRPIEHILPGKDALSVLEDFKNQRRQMAVIVDTYGGFNGVITTHDLLEALVGDLADFEGEDHSIIMREDGSYLVDASVDVQEVLFKMGKSTLESEDSKEFHSVGGIVFRQMNRVPQVGAKIDWKGLTIEVVDMDGYRIDKVLVTAATSTEGHTYTRSDERDN